MKGQSKRFVDHEGDSYETVIKKNRQSNNVTFLKLWRYATLSEKLATLVGVVIAWICSAGLVAAVIIYGELTSLFVQRHKAAATTPQAYILQLFGGGNVLPAGNRSAHMDALIDDSKAFALSSITIMLIQFITAALAVTLANWAASRMVTRLRWRLLCSVLRQEMAFFDTNSTMNFASTLTDDMEKLRMGVGEHVVMTSYLAGSVVAACFVSLYYGWQLTLAGLSVVPVALIVATTVAKYQTKWSGKEVTAYGAAGRVVEEVLAAIRTVRAYGGQELEVKRYTAGLKPAARAARRRMLWAGTGAGLGWLLTYALNAIVLAYGAALCVRDMDLPPEEQEYHPGVMVTILFCTFMAAQNIAMCNPHLEIFATGRGAAKSIFKLLERKSQIDAMDDVGAKPEMFKGDIVFENLYFNYPSRPDVKILRGFTLKVSAGETVALVGGSGCGKSTVLQLLQRLYEPQSGSITVDGHQLNQLNLHNFRSSIGVVGQEPVLFSGTIRDNITLGHENVSDADVIAAAKTAFAHQFITKLAQGYDTPLGERGASLSGGQKQRIAIARAVLRRPALLLLDEPTAALDPAAERQVQAALDAASKGRTTLVVSHRLATITNANRIVYVEQGTVAEEGTHDELLRKQGLYWKLLQHDSTAKSIENTLVSTKLDDDDDVPEPEDNSFQRVFSHSSIKGSMTPEHCLRGSRRLASLSLMQTTRAPETLPEVTETEEEAAEKPVSTWKLAKLNAPEWPLLLGGGVASFLVGATMPAFAVLFSELYGMFASSDPDEILTLSQLYAGLFATVAAVCGLVTFLQTWLLSLAGARLTDRLREMVFRNLLAQDQGWFDSPKNSVGALCARLATDCAAVQGATGTRLGTVLQGVSTMLIGVSLAMFFSWKMTLVSLLSVPCVIGGIYLEGVVTRACESRTRAALEGASRLATEALMNVRTVHSLAVEQTILERYRSALVSSKVGAISIRGPVYGLCLCAPTLGYAVSLAYGGYLIAREGLQYQYAILVSEALIYGAWMLAESLSFAPNFAAARRSGTRIVHALERQPRVQTEPTAVDLPGWKAEGAVNFDKVHFQYPTRPGVPVLRGFQLDIAPGRSVALVGASGSGKSTAMSLLLRNYDPDSGKVEVDGRDIRRAVPLDTLRAQLGLVSQEPALFERSLRDNIAYGDNSRHVPMDEIVAAAKAANIHSFIAGLPLGYATVVRAGGGALSGGQRQRVAIARALVRDPRLLLLDEATSALDAASEKIVQAALEAASQSRTTLIIAHRLATIQHVDTICVVEKGVIAESGSHDELVKKRGLYWELLQQQSGNA